MKKVLKWIGTIFIGLIIIGAMMGREEEGSKTNIVNYRILKQEASSQSFTEASKENIDEEYFNIGDMVRVGDLEYIVNEVSQADEVGNEYYNEKANGVFLILNITVTNKGKEGKTIDSSMFKLIENGGIEYDAHSTAAVHIGENDNFSLVQLNSKLSKTGYIVFDVPTMNSSYALKVTRGFWSNEGSLIYLSNE